MGAIDVFCHLPPFVPLFSGLENGRTADLAAYAIGRNWMYGANLFYRLAPNVLLGAEVSQARTTYIDSSSD
jgi:hypothetical protein